MNNITTSENNKISAESLHERAASVIRNMIIEGKLTSGKQISENLLCDELGISRTPLREALRVLASEGLVSLLPRRGAIVTEITSEDLEEKFELARILEVEAIKKVCENIDEEQLEILETIHKRLISSHKKGRRKEYFQHNEDFHKAIIKLAGNKYIVEIHNSLTAHLRRARLLGMKIRDMDDQFIDAHEKIMQALRNRDSKTAQEEMASHQIIRAKDALKMLSKINDPY